MGQFLDKADGAFGDSAQCPMQTIEDTSNVADFRFLFRTLFQDSL